MVYIFVTYRVQQKSGPLELFAVFSATISNFLFEILQIYLLKPFTFNCQVKFDRSIAHLVLDFVAMTTMVVRGKIQLAAFDGPFPKTPPQMQKNLAKIFHIRRVITILSQILLPWQRGSVGENAIGSIRWPIPVNPPPI